ncbi:MAG: TAXI family TRAP transporter solute-binding subunit [Desulfomonilaceae bacterium]|nr:TAXI family TRAP transporter solute-binding subunit [Desulfomonilaceae bacterium]
MITFIRRPYDRYTRVFLTFLFLVTGLAAAPVVNVNASDQDKTRETARISVLVATGMPGGTYYRVGLGMASLWTTRLRATGIRVSAAISEGSRENIEAIRIADADLILAESAFCTMAYSGTGIYEDNPLPELRSVTALWPDVVHFLIRSEAMRSGTLADLEGVTVATGLPESGARYTTQMVLGTLKSGGKSVQLRSMSNMAAAEALRNGTVQALTVTGGIPVPLVVTLLQENPGRFSLLEIAEPSFMALRDRNVMNILRLVIPPRTYPGQVNAVKSVGFGNVLATTSSLSSQVVYQLTKTLYQNLDYLTGVHPACREIGLDRAFRDVQIPLHPGAILYFRERNVDIPEHLVPR